MKKLLTILFFSVLATNTVFSQNNSLNDFYISSIDSLINKELTFQKDNRSTETLVFLKDSTISYYYDDLTLPCENQPLIYNYTYNINGLITLIETRDTPEEGCIISKRRDIFTYDEENVTSHLIKYLDADTNEWNNSSKRIYQYDENNNEIEDLWIKWDIENETWYNYLKIVKIFNDDLLIEDNRERWLTATNEWFLDLKRSYSYDNDSNIIDYTYKLWDNEINDWETLSKRTYLYDADSNLIEFIDFRKYQNEEVYEWSSIFKHIYSYNAYNQLIEDLSYSSWNNETNDWESLFKYNYTNNSAGNPIEVLVFKWDFISEIWNNYSQTEITYNSNQQLTEEYKQKWDPLISNWENYSLKTVLYNDDYQKLESKLEYWSTDYWYVESKNTYQYDENQNLINITGFDTFDWWSSTHYYSEYDILLNNSENDLQNPISIFPNPSSDFININGIEDEVRIIIYNLTGKKVLETSAKNNIDVSSLNKGVYIVNVKSSTLNKNMKLVKN